MQRPGVMQSPPFMQRGVHSAEKHEEQKNITGVIATIYVNTQYIDSLSYFSFCWM